MSATVLEDSLPVTTSSGRIYVRATKIWSVEWAVQTTLTATNLDHPPKLILLQKEAIDSFRTWLARKLKIFFVYHIRVDARVLPSPVQLTLSKIYLSSAVFLKCLWCGSNTVCRTLYALSLLVLSQQGIPLTPMNFIYAKYYLIRRFTIITCLNFWV